jgi:hypothetical protein
MDWYPDGEVGPEASALRHSAVTLLSKLPVIAKEPKNEHH